MKKKKERRSPRHEPYLPWGAWKKNNTCIKQAERDGQSEAIATNLTAMAGLKVPIVTLIMGEGGSGGALGVGMGNRVGMLSRAYFGVVRGLCYPPSLFPLGVCRE